MKRMLSILIIVSLLGIGIPTVFRTIHRRIVGVNSGVTLNGRNMEYYYPKEVRIIVEQFARSMNQEPINASLEKVTGSIVPEKNGLIVDIDKTVYDVIHAPAGSQLTVSIIEVLPEFRKEHLELLTDILGDFSTPLMGGPGRINNLKLSLAAMNNTIVMPGEVFSFNEVVGERAEEKGYKHAPIILGETVVPGVGGGVCQISTTLYNAVKRAGLEIVERSIHSLPPSYIRHGDDAAVAWPYTDFKFRNNRSTAIIVKAEPQGWRARVWIVGIDEEEEGAR